MITFAEAKIAFVKALYRLLEQSDEQEWFTAQQIAASSGLGVRGAFAARVIRVSEEEEDLFHVSYDEGEAYYSLGRAGFDLAEKNQGSYDELSWVPASDRIVTLDHNAPVTREIQSALEKLEEELRSDNEAFATEPDDRAAAVAEVSALRRLWAANRVRMDAFQVQARAALAWISKKASAVAIAQACKHLMKLILGWS